MRADGQTGIQEAYMLFAIFAKAPKIRNKIYSTLTIIIFEQHLSRRLIVLVTDLTHINFNRRFLTLSGVVESWVKVIMNKRELNLLAVLKRQVTMASQHKDTGNGTVEWSASLPRIWKVRSSNFGSAQRYPWYSSPIPSEFHDVCGHKLFSPGTLKFITHNHAGVSHAVEKQS